MVGHMEPHFGGRGGRRGSAMTPLERAMVVFYRLSIVTVALTVTIRPQFAIECLRRSNQHRCDKRQKIIVNVNKRVYSEKDSKRL